MIEAIQFMHKGQGLDYRYLILTTSMMKVCVRSVAAFEKPRHKVSMLHVSNLPHQTGEMYRSPC
jgi:hypothetical protein